MGKGFKNKSRKKYDFKSKIIARQVDKIDYLQKQISALEIDNSKKDELIKSIDILRNDLFDTIIELKDKSEKYNELISELIQMKNAINQTVFNGRWKLIRFLLK